MPDELRDEAGLEGTEAPGGLGPLPRFPHSTTIRPTPPPPPQPPPAATTEEAPETVSLPSGLGSAGSSDTRSSKASTEPSAVDLKDLQAAARQLSDVLFVDVAQGIGWLEKRTKNLPAVDRKWVPTKTERSLVSDPFARLAKRHVTADVTALDTIDALMIAAGIGSFVTRRAFDIESLDGQ